LILLISLIPDFVSDYFGGMKIRLDDEILEIKRLAGSGPPTSGCKESIIGDII